MGNNITKNTQLSRRDFIKITAVAGGALLGGKLLLDRIDGKVFTIKETRLLMGTIINLSLIANSKGAGEAAVEATFTELERQIAIFNHRTPTSPVAMLNRNGMLGSPPAELVEVLKMAQSISNLTSRAFDVTVKPLLDLYQQSQPNLPTEEQIQTALLLVNYENLAVSDEAIAFSKPGMAITLDGIAKGYIVDAGVAELRKLGFDNVFVEAGGDLMASGEKAEQTAWMVGVQSPRQSQAGLLASFGVKGRAVATSGDYMNSFSVDMRYHHILDPRIGVSSPYLASATVVALTCAQADALATALMVMEPEDGLALMDDIANIDALLIGKNLEKYRSSGFKDRLH